MIGQTKSEVQPIRSSLARLLWNFWRNLFSGVYILLSFLIVFFAFSGDSTTNQPELLLFYTLAVYFPFTYLAYWAVRTEMRRTRLEEELFLLGYSKEEATRLYGQVHDQTSYLLFITLAMLTTIIGTSFLFGVPASIPIEPITIQAMRYGFFGSYLFSAFLVYRRFSTNDLHPTVYLYAAFTMIAGIVFNYVAIEAITSITNSSGEATGVAAGLLAIVAFSLGYFPYLAVRWFNRLAFTSLGVNQRRTDSLPLSLIDGISEWHETRLRDTGIDDIQNLASSEIRELLVNTAFNVQEIIEWIDQATLYLYLEASEIDSFRRAKIRMTSDFCTLWELAMLNEEKRTEVVLNLQSTEERLTVLYSSLIEGPNVHRVLNYWKRAKSQVDANLNIAGLQSQRELLKHITERLDYSFDKDSHYELLAALAKDYGGLLVNLWHNPSEDDILNLGKLYFSLGEYDEANKQFDEIIKKIAKATLTETQFSAYRGRIFGNTYNSNFEDALQDCDNLIAMTTDLRKLHVDAYGIKGDILARFNQPDEAVIAYQKAIEIEPQNSECYNKLAWHYVSYQATIDKLPLALEIAKKAVQLAYGKPDYTAALDTLAYVQMLYADLLQAENGENPVIVQLYNEAFSNLQTALQYPHDIPSFGYNEIRNHLWQIADFWANRHDIDVQSVENEENVLLTLLTIPILDSVDRNNLAVRLKDLRFVSVGLLSAPNNVTPYELPAPITPIDPPTDSQAT